MNIVAKWLDNYDADYVSRISAFKAIYLLAIVFTYLGISKSDYKTYDLLLALFAMLNYNNPNLTSYKQKDYNVMLLFVLTAFWIIALNMLFSVQLYFCLFVFVAFFITLYIATTRYPVMVPVIMQSAAVGIVSVYVVKQYDNALDQVIDVLTIGIVTFWALKFFPNKHDLLWRMSYADLLKFLSSRLDSNSEDIKRFISSRHKIISYDRYLIFKPKYLNYFRFNAAFYVYHSFIERARDANLNDTQTQIIKADILAFANAIKQNVKYIDVPINTESALDNTLVLHKNVLGKMAKYWNALC